MAGCGACARSVTAVVALLAVAFLSSAAGQDAVAPDNCPSVADVLLQDGNYSLLLTAADTAGLTSILADPTLSGTLLAPTDTAILEFLGFVDGNAASLLEDPALADIISYHFIPDALLNSESYAATLEGLNATDGTAAINATLVAADFNGTLTTSAFLTAEGSLVYFFTVDAPSSAAYFLVPEGSVVALSPITAATVDVDGALSSCYANIYPINTVLLPDDVLSDTTLAFLAAADAAAATPEAAPAAQTN